MMFGTLLICFVFGYFTSAAIIPTGFIPLPPLPVSNKKTTPIPTTKKPVITKATFPPTTPRPTTTQSTLPSSVAAPTSGLPPSQSSNCGLNVNIPGANCNGGSSNSVVQQALVTLQQQLDKTRQQHQAQNTALQAMISQLQTRQVAYINKISDLQNEVANLVQAYNSLSRPTSTPKPLSTSAPVTSGVSNSALQQALQAVRNDINRAVGDFNNRIFNLSAIMYTNEQQELQVHQKIESQIQQQASEIGQLSQRVIDLDNLLRQLNTTSGTGSSAATAADIASLRAQINQVASDIQLYDRSQQSQFTTLNLQTGSLLGDVNNHTTELNILRSNLLLDQSRIRNVEKNVTVVHDALAQFRTQVVPQMNQLNADVQGLQANVTKVEGRVKSLDSSVFKVVVNLGKDEQTITGLQGQAGQLKTDVSNLQSDLNQQTQEITSIKQGMIDLKNAIPVSELNAMNNIILLAINNGSLTTSQLQNLTQAITTITNKLALLNPPASSG